MIDKETYEREITRMFDSVRTKNKGCSDCRGVPCSRCPLEGQCRITAWNVFKMIEFVEQWSKEHQPKKLTRLEYDVLKYLSDNTTHRYIIRDNYRNIYLFDKKPKKSGGIWYGNGAHSMAVFNKLFQFVQREDKEPTEIKYILESCEVKEDV